MPELTPNQRSAKTAELNLIELCLQDFRGEFQDAMAATRNRDDLQVGRFLREATRSFSAYFEGFISYIFKYGISNSVQGVDAETGLWQKVYTLRALAEKRSGFPIEVPSLPLITMSNILRHPTSKASNPEDRTSTLSAAEFDKLTLSMVKQESEKAYAFLQYLHLACSLHPILLRDSELLEHELNNMSPSDWVWKAGWEKKIESEARTGFNALLHGKKPFIFAEQFRSLINVVRRKTRTVTNASRLSSRKEKVR